MSGSLTAGLTLWEDAGQPVSMAGLTRPAAGEVRVGPVYTPPGLRGKGYAGAVTCEVSQAARDAGANPARSRPVDLPGQTSPTMPTGSGSAYHHLQDAGHPGSSTARRRAAPSGQGG